MKTVERYKFERELHKFRSKKGAEGQLDKPVSRKEIADLFQRLIECTEDD